MNTMDEEQALRWLYDQLPVGDDCFVVDYAGEKLLLTTDMLHKSADFPTGVTDYTIGWRSVGATLSDVAAMGGTPRQLLVAYGAPEFSQRDLESFLEGALDVSEPTEAEIVGGDLDRHPEMTVVTTGIGTVTSPVLRTGAQPGDLVAVTGNLGRTAAALKLFEFGDVQQGNRLFRFSPRVEQGQQLTSVATSMIDVSDGLARSIHQLSELNDVGFAVEFDRLPFVDEVEDIADGVEQKAEMGLYTGEDYELLFTASSDQKFNLARFGATVIGEVLRGENTLHVGGETVPLENRGYVH